MQNKFIEVCKRFIPRGRYTHTLFFYFKKRLLPILLVLLGVAIGFLLSQIFFKEVMVQEKITILYKDPSYCTIPDKEAFCIGAIIGGKG